MVMSAFLAVVLMGAGKYQPPPDKMLVLIGCDNFQSYRRLTGDTPAGGVFWYEFNGDTSFFERNAALVGEGVLAVHFSLPDKKTVREIISGDRDENIKKIGAAFRGWGQPIYVAIGPEFDHKDNRAKYTAAQYVSVFRRVHRIWDEMDVSNVSYVWHSCVENLSERTWAYYPGDKYVDWFGISLYWPAQFRDARQFASAAHRRNKPLIVMESSPIRGRAESFEDWHGPFLRECADLGVRALCYNNFGDHPLIAAPFKHSAFDYQSKSIVRGWAREMKQPLYLHAGQLYNPSYGTKMAPQVTIDTSPRDNHGRHQGSSGRVGRRQAGSQP